jgi:HEAT repeat protein
VRFRLLVPAAGLAVLLCASGPARAEHDEFGGLAGRLRLLASPARVEDVSRLLRDPRFEAADGALLLARALATAGGYAAADGLVELLRHEAPEVRKAALRGLSEIGIRSERGTRAVREAVGSPDAGVAVAAVECLGRVGDGRDVPTFLKGLSGESGAIRTASFRAIRDLSGLWLTASPTRWTQWWTKAEARAGVELERTVQAIEALDDPEADLESLRASLRRRAWIDLPTGLAVAQSWLHSTRPSLRAEGFRLVAALRLADLASEVRAAMRFAREGEDAWAAADAARVLGIPPEESDALEEPSR